MPRRRSDSRTQRRLGLPLSAAALALAAVLAFASPQDHAPGGADLSVSLADGTLSHDNSRDGAAILTASQVWPGWSGSGDLTITNDGTAGSWLRLTEAAVDDLPGPGGGVLSNRLALVVEDVTEPGFPVPVYSGKLSAVGERWLGRMEPGEARSYRFRTAMPTGPSDNSFQASAVSVRFEWAVSDTEPAASPPDPDPDPDPGPVDPPATDPDPPVDDPAVNDPDVPSDDPGTPDDDPPVIVPEGPPVVVVKRGTLGVTLAIPVTQNPLRKRSLLVLTRCSRRCRVSLSGRLGARGKASGYAMARRSRALPAGVKMRMRLRLSRRAVLRTRRALLHGRAVPGYVRVVARDRSGRVARAKQRIRLVPVRR
jgi:hypothetical protein